MIWLAYGEFNQKYALSYILQLIVFVVASLLHGITRVGFPIIRIVALAILFSLTKAIRGMSFMLKKSQK